MNEQSTICHYFGLHPSAPWSFLQAVVCVAGHENSMTPAASPARDYASAHSWKSMKEAPACKYIASVEASHQTQAPVMCIGRFHCYVGCSRLAAHRKGNDYPERSQASNSPSPQVERPRRRSSQPQYHTKLPSGQDCSAYSSRLWVRYGRQRRHVWQRLR